MIANNEARALTFLGLCMRAGQLISGQDACVTAVRGGGAAMALLDEDASPNTRKRMVDVCHNYSVPLYLVSPDALGQAIGKAGRMAVVLPPGGMAQKMLELFREQPQL